MTEYKQHILTRMIKAGEGPDLSGIRTPAVPIFQTTNYLYEDVDKGTEILLSKRPGHIYSRYTNPTVDAVNEILASLEESESALSFASGMAAISSTTKFVLPFMRLKDCRR